MGSKSKSSNETVNNTTNYSLQGMESASTVVAGNNNQVYSTTTDYGAVAAAEKISREAIEAANKAARESAAASAAAAEAAAKAASDSLKQGFAFGETAIELNGVVISDAMDLSYDSLDRVSDFGETAMESSNKSLMAGLEFAETLVDQNTANAANNQRAMAELAKSVQSGGATDMADLTKKTVYTVGALIGVMLLGFILMGGRK